LVEDDPSMMSLLREVCLMQNYDAREATTGRTALQLAAAGRPDLVLLDWELPDISGIEVCQELRRAGIAVPILMLTGRSDDRDVVAGLEHGVDEYLTKPVRPTVLAARLAANLRRAFATSEKVDAEVSRTLALLEGVSIFLNHPRAALRRLAKQAISVDVKKGAVLLSQGEPNHFLFVIQSGSFQVTLKRSNGEALPIALLAEGDFFGAASLLSGKPAAAAAVAREHSTLVRISRDHLLEALVAGSPARAGFDHVVAQRRAILEVAQSRTRSSATGDTICFYSPKGGVGKTTLALNLAATLARHHPGEVLLLDFSLPYNHAALLAQLAPTTSLARLADVESEFDQRLETGLAYHRAGFHVLSSALAPEESDLITPALVDRALAVLRPQFRFLIVDFGVVLSEAALSMLEQAQAVVVVASPELLIIKDLISLYGILRDVLKLPEDQIHLVINHRSKTATVGAREMEKLLNVGVALEIRHDGKRPEEAALHGQILALSAARSPIAKAAASLARAIARP